MPARKKIILGDDEGQDKSTKLKQKSESKEKPQKLVQKKLKMVDKEGNEAQFQQTQVVSAFRMQVESGDGKFDKNEINISSWNVNGLRANLAKVDFMKYFESSKFDIICLNETKIDEETYVKTDIKSKFPQEYFQYINCSKPPKNGYSGVAIYSKVKPISIKCDLGISKHDAEGRTLTVEYDKFYLISCYVPNSGQKLERLGYRVKEWDADFQVFLNDLRKIKPTILCGDLNVCHKEIDIHNPKGNDKTSGFTKEERESFTEFLGDQWVDSFRYLNPTLQKFSWFSQRTKAREANKGWRLDYFVIDDKHKEAILTSDINGLVYGSDHLPIEIKLDLTKL